MASEHGRGYAVLVIVKLRPDLHEFFALKSTVFGPDFGKLELADVEAFLAQPLLETITWEAKGGDIRPEQVEAAASAFANNGRGGFLIVGANWDKATKRWSVAGVDKDLSTWITNILANLDNAPPFDVAGPWRVAER